MACCMLCHPLLSPDNNTTKTIANNNPRPRICTLLPRTSFASSMSYHIPAWYCRLTTYNQSLPAGTSPDLSVSLDISESNHKCLMLYASNIHVFLHIQMLVTWQSIIITLACHLTRWTHCKCLLYASSNHSALLVKCCHLATPSYTMLCAPSATFPYVSKCNNKILTLLVFSEPKLRDQPPKSLCYLPTVETTHPLCSQPTLLQNRISPRYSCRANTQELPRWKSTGSTYDTTAQPSCVLAHKACNLAITIDSTYFVLHRVCYISYHVLHCRLPMHNQSLPLCYGLTSLLLPDNFSKIRNYLAIWQLKYFGGDQANTVILCHLYCMTLCHVSHAPSM